MTTHHIGPAASTGAADAPLRSSTRPPKLERDLFIGNQWRPSSTGQTIGLVNSATEQPFGRARNPSTTACSARFFVRAPRPTGQAERAGTATAHSSQLISGRTCQEEVDAVGIMPGGGAGP